MARGSTGASDPAARAAVRVRRIRTVPEPGADYTSVFEVTPAGSGPAHGWLRAVFDGAPAPYRRLLRAGWLLALRLHLASATDPAHVQGWTLAIDGPDRASLTAAGPRVAARNDVRRAGAALTWTTVVSYRSPVGRALWTVAAPVHHLTLPWLLRRAARRADSRRTS
jgi:hypothetical protein